MSGNLDEILTASDRFAVFGLERRFDIDLATLDQRHRELAEQAGALGDRDQAAKLIEKLDGDRRMLADPVSRGDHLLKLLGGAADAPTKDVPPGFKNNPIDSKRLTAEATRLFKMLGNADNGVVQRERRRQIRMTLNALRLAQSADR